jgi:glycosyltransferase involved in cell wall biosynthesis
VNAPGVRAVRYLVVSPVKDEERHVERTLDTVAAQTVRPARWIIVDDGSTDRTPEILRRYAEGRGWIEVATRRNDGARQPGSAVMNAFYHGLERVRPADYDYIVKLDCDVDLPADYFERLFGEFERDSRLGIASGIYLEESAGSWQAISMPAYHAAGASKVMRTRCFEDIGGFVRERGWDTVDEVRAQVRGWRTRHFPEVQFRHLKPEGSGIGSVRTNAMHGDVYFLTGGGPLFLLFKAAHRMIAGSPPVVGGLAMLYGYARSALSGRARLVTPEEAQHYRRLLNRRILRLARGAERSGGLDSLKSP